MLAFMSNTKKECVQMPSKMARSAPQPAFGLAMGRSSTRVCGFYAIEKIDIVHGSNFLELHGRPGATGALEGGY
jgi:hypothetical protein